MTQDNPRRRSWQRKPPLTTEQEVARHSRRSSKKRYGIRLRWRIQWADSPDEYTLWYETPRARADALEQLKFKREAEDIIGLVERT